MPRFSPTGKAIYYPIKPNGKHGKGMLQKEVVMFCDHEEQVRKLDERLPSLSFLYVKSAKREYKFYFPLDMSDEDVGVECRKLFNISLERLN